MKRNLAASVRARLLTLAQARGMIYNQALVRYALEGLLLRLSLSPHADRFILKGAMLYVLWKPDAPPRATQDLDLLCFGPPEPAVCRELFEEIAHLQLNQPDGLSFDSVQASPIRLEDLYGGIRVNLTAHLDTARIPLQVDLGFGDRPVPEALRLQYPALLREQKPHLRVYAQETVIAEKLHAMVERGLTNSRAKDFFDISYLAEHFPFECPTLSAAIQSTFERRGRTLPAAGPIVAWTPQFYDDPVKQSQWAAFLRKTGLSANPLPDVMAQIESFLHLPLSCAQEQQAIPASWPPGGPWTSRNSNVHLGKSF